MISAYVAFPPACVLHRNAVSDHVKTLLSFFLSFFLSRVRVSGNSEIRTDDPRGGRVVAHARGGPQRLPRRSDEREPARFVSIPLSSFDSYLRFPRTP